MPRLGPVRTLTQPPERPLVFLDIEASSLSPDSWPVEIGCAWIGPAGVEMREALIRPRADWPLSSWSERAEQVHGLCLAQLEAAGYPAENVAAATDALAGVDLVSNNPHWDAYWLARLRGPERPALRVRLLRGVAAARLDAAAADRFALALLRRTAPHRAGADAMQLATAWAEALAPNPWTTATAAA